MPKKNLSHAEFWDDSALVSSWNEALAEYKKYHSLAAKGEKVELLLEQAKQDDLGTQDPIATEDEALPRSESKVNGEVTSGAAAVTQAAPVAQPLAPQIGTAAIPQALLGAVQDEGMKNLMMSWYYAGYYTGLYEGKQQALASTQSHG
ncbi:hypothetical protein LTR78_006376 [Recurvomyces mirabilis]|uniref:Survival motor neuron Tudor domain-containing protein n=1 Tax=Recurvomyces mirabilis TaxID=574656 RepID=A0AAE1C065_9PEZI|nr:hypothetical protein LTR78_006376 [Recurvomyces mirabilis]KAK5152263.1 hypothetical protein LTS14_008640 [Recurvomyces mirabilis]